MPMQCTLTLPKFTHRILVHSLSAFPLAAMECTLVMMVHLYHGSALNPFIVGIIIVTPSWDAVEILRSSISLYCLVKLLQGTEWIGVWVDCGGNIKSYSSVILARSIFGRNNVSSLLFIVVGLISWPDLYALLMLLWQHQKLLINHFSSFHFWQQWQFLPIKWLSVPFGRNCTLVSHPAEHESSLCQCRQKWHAIIGKYFPSCAKFGTWMYLVSTNN